MPLVLDYCYSKKINILSKHTNMYIYKYINIYMIYIDENFFKNFFEVCLATI